MADRDDMVPWISDALLDALDPGDVDTPGAVAIEAAQAEVAAYPADRPFVVQGSPGTGRTHVGLRRAAWLTSQCSEHARADDILMVGPDPAWVRRAADALEAFGDDALLLLPLTALGPRVRVSRQDPPDLRRLKGDRRLLRVVLRGLRNRQRVAPGTIEITVEDRRLRLDDARFANRARLLGGRPHNEAHRELRAHLLDELRSRLGPSRVRDQTGQSPASRAVDRHLARVWPNLTPQSFLVELLSSPRHLRAAAAGVLSDDEIDLLAIPEGTRVGGWRWSADDVPLLDAADALLNGPPVTYGHVLVDEAEDYSPLQLESIRRRVRHGAVTVLGDLGQARGAWAHTSWDDVIELLARDRHPVTTIQLDLAYRLPAEVHEVAMRLLPEAAPTVKRPIAVRPSGHEVQVHDAGGTGLAAGVVATVRALLGTGLMAVIVPESARTTVTAALDDAGVEWAQEIRDATGPIVVVSPDQAKGVEFETVVVVEPSEIVNEAAHGARALFIALTRCTGRLAVVHELALPAVLELDVPPSADDTTVDSAERLDGDAPTATADNAEVVDERQAIPEVQPFPEADEDDEPANPVDESREGVVVALRGIPPRETRTSPTGVVGEPDVDVVVHHVEPTEPGVEPVDDTTTRAHGALGDAVVDEQPVERLIGWTTERPVSEAASGVAAGAFSELDRTVARAVAKALTDELSRCVTPALLPLVADEVVRMVGPLPAQRLTDEERAERTDRPD